jgi:hypothetical protein
LEVGLSEVVSLEGAGFFDPLPDIGAGFAGAGAAEFVEGDAGNFDPNAPPNALQTLLVIS